jgi:GDP-L-fucose synthase
MNKESRIYIAGHRGLVGSAIVRHLQQEGYANLVVRSRAELDLTNQQAVADFFSQERPEYVFLAAAKVGGIHANNTYPAEFIYQNLMIQSNVIHQSYLHGIKRLLFLGSSCIYPRLSPQPIKEEYLLSGYLEPTNDAYAVAKISGIMLCESYNRQYGTQFISAMPTNQYGVNDNFDLQSSHVLPAMIRKFHLAKLATDGNWEAIEEDEKRFGPIPQDIRRFLGAAGDAGTPIDSPEIILWGSGTPRREFMHVDDLAAACFYLMNLPVKNITRQNHGTAAAPSEKNVPLFFNVGSGRDSTINELAGIVADIVGYHGKIRWDADKPDGMPQKLLDVSKLSQLGWQAQIQLSDGIRSVYQWYQQQTVSP